jgi:thioredoxin reductase
MVLKLSFHADRVYWVVPASKLDIQQGIKNEIEKSKRIEIFYSSSLKKINGSNDVNSITILSAGQEKTLSVRQVFLPASQHRPVTDYLNGAGIQSAQDGAVMVSQMLETNVAGVFAAGDILCSKPQSSLICAAQGMIATLSAGRFLKK